VVGVRLDGRVDREAVGVLDEAYAAASAGAASTVLLDFTSVDYINSTGIALVVGLLGRARGDGLRVQATGLTDHFRHIFEITRLVDFIEIVDPVSRRDSHA
jgi:anti-sigma B factor antagonist